MNEYLKAIDTIGKIQEFEGHSYYPLEVPIGFKLKYQKEFGMLLKLASKSEPIKPKKLKTPSLLDSPIYATHKCECGYLLIEDTYENYCSQCGKKIDWIEYESK